jgi:signal transduction histidine kinase
LKSIQQIKNDLAELLAAGELDFGKILRLAGELSAHDPDFLRFSVDSAIISRLGQQLVARQETAVSEIVKNAYDADAEEVRLVFNEVDKPGGRLFVKDDGVGMERQQLIDGFMRLASTEKIHEPKSPKYGRLRAGRKGIGRFAAQRLGRTLTLITQTSASKKALRLEIDWTLFERERDLFQIPNRIEEIPKERDCGTTLIIDGLREAWSDAEMARVYRYVEDLIQPSSLFKKRLTSTKDPGFQAIFCRLIGGKEVIVASEEKMVFDYALATVTGEVDGIGHAKWGVKSSQLNLDEQNNRISQIEHSPGVAFKFLRNVKFTAYYFIWSTEYVPGHQLARLRDLSAIRGGIRLYRNGFRVLPYGEPYNDWLSLDAAYRKRELLPPIGNTNWFGFVELHDSDGKYFDETSSREGLTQNIYYNELVEFLSGSLKAAALRIAAARGKKQKASQKGYRKRPPSSTPVALEQAADELERTAVALEKKREPGSAQTVRGVAQYLKTAAVESQNLIQELAMLRVFASLGLTIGIFTHEVRTRLTALRCDVHQLFDSESTKEEFEEGLVNIDTHLKMLQSYSSYFDSTISASVQRELLPQELGEIVHSFIREFAPVIKRSGIIFEKIDIDHDLFTRPMHKSEWASVLANFLTNSVKAIKRAGKGNNGKLCIKAWREANTLFLDFADNGDGIPKENKEKVFDAFFTTTRSAKSITSEVDELTGTGLGLKIVHDIISSAGGEVYVTSAPKQFVTCFRIEIPAATKEDLKDAQI